MGKTRRRRQEEEDNMFSRVATRAVKQTQRRNMSGLALGQKITKETTNEAVAQMEQWKKISYGMIGMVGVFTVINVVDHFSHGHEEHEEPAYEYLHIRNKPYPWKNHDCGFFDVECNSKANAARKAL